MTSYIVKRLLIAIPTLFGVTVVVFVLMRVTPGDVADAYVTLESQTGFTQEQQEVIKKRIRAEVGLDQPMYVQYARWIRDIAKGTFGWSYWQDRPVMHMIRERAPVTIELSLLAIAMAILWALPVGFAAAMKQNTWIDQVLRIATVAGLSIPNFFIAIMLIFFLAAVFNWLPPLIFVQLWEDPKVHLQQIIFPALVLAYGTGAPIARLTRSEVLDTLREDYVRTARAKGLQEPVILYRHVLRNAIIPALTMAGWSLGRMLGGVVVIETVFLLPGVGFLLITSVLLRDYEVVGATVLLLAVAFTFINLAVDVLYGVIDPRVRFD